MKTLVRETLLAIALVLASHALAYFLLTVLPDSSFSGLGIFAGNQDAVVQWRSRSAESYDIRFFNLLQGDFGHSLDNISVAQQILNALLVSTPHLVLSLVLLCLGVWFVGTKGTPGGHGEVVANYLNFLPPYVTIALLVITSILFGSAWGVSTLTAALALTVPPLALLCAQIYRITDVNLLSDHVRLHVALGASHVQVRKRLLKNLVHELLPSLHNVALMLLASLLFVEVLVGIGGIGSLTARAIKRVDIDLSLGLVVFYGLMAAGVQVLSRVVRAQYPD